jgi:two-component sensor histidine kinase
MTNSEPNQPSESRLARIEKLVESNAKAIQAQGDQIAIDRELARQYSEESRASSRESRAELQEIQKLIESNAKAIQAQGDQSAADLDLSRQFREETRAEMRELGRETRAEIRELAGLIRTLYESSQIQEREIRMQAGEIQNLADSIHNLYSIQPPRST